MNTINLQFGSRGKDVKKLQKELGISSDGIFGKQTRKALLSYQKKNNLAVDGIAGKQTFSSLYKQNSTPANSLYKQNSTQAPTKYKQKQTLAPVKYKQKPTPAPTKYKQKPTPAPANSFEQKPTPAAEDIDLSTIVSDKKPMIQDTFIKQQDDKQLKILEQNIQNADNNLNQEILSLSKEPVNQLPFENEQQKLQSEISYIEEKIAHQAQIKNDAYEESGLFEDMSRLNELQDKFIEIPIKAKQTIRNSRGGTYHDFNVLTSQDIENNTLQTLAQSRKVESLTNIINLKLKADYDKIKFVYEGKIKQLERINTIHSDILSNKQKIDIENRKFENELLLAEAKTDMDIRSNLLKGIVTKGGFSNDMQYLQNASLFELMSYSANQVQGGTKNWNSLDYQTAAETLPENQFKAWQKYTETKNENIKQSAARVQESEFLLSSLGDLLKNSQGIRSGVGPNYATRGLNYLDPRDVISGKSTRNKFRADLKQVIAVLTLDTLKRLKSTGATMGALNTREGQWLQDANQSLGLIIKYGDNGEEIITGSNLSENEFVKQVKVLETITRKGILFETLSPDVFKGLNLKNLDYDDINELYNLSQNGGEEFRDEMAKGLDLVKESSLVIDFIKQEEGFKNKAYLDLTGTPTIGFGTTRINGRPVQLGDTLTKDQANSLLSSQINSQYSSFKSRVQVPLTQGQKAALTSFEYNLGSGIWDKGAQKIIDKINQGDLQGAGEIMKRYNKARVDENLVALSGLTNRRNKEVQLLNNFA